MTTTTLKAKSSADFLAALPRLTGMIAPGSIYLVPFTGARAAGSVRTDLPTARMLTGDSVFEFKLWMREFAKLAAMFDTAAIIMHTTETLTEQPWDSPHGRLAGALSELFASAETTVRELCVIGEDGWCSFATEQTPQLCSHEEILHSPLYDPELQLLDLNAWRAAHPGNTTEDAAEIRHLYDRMMQDAATIA